MKTKLLSLCVSSLLVITGCAVTGEAEDRWDEEEKEAKISLDGFLGKSKDSENKALKERIERLESENKQTPQQLPASNSKAAGGITPPSMNRSTAGQSSTNSVSYQEWLNAKNGNSDEYQKFKEYQEWLEFQRQQKQ